MLFKKKIMQLPKFDGPYKLFKSEDGKCFVLACPELKNMPSTTLLGFTEISAKASLDFANCVVRAMEEKL